MFFFVLKTENNGSFKKHLLIVFICFMKIILKNHYINKMIKNKTLDIKNILKIYLKILKYVKNISIWQTNFYFLKHQSIILKNYS